MCGRYSNTRTESDVLSRRMADLLGVRQLGEGRGYERFNVAPTDEVLAAVADEDGRRLELLRWGLLPAWAQREKPRNPMINARAETVRERPAYRDLIEQASSRCLVLADGWYEWQKPEDPKQPRRPLRFSLPDGEPFCFAGLWTAGSCTIVTCQANDIARPIHDRMPVVFADPPDWEAWLDPRLDGRDVAGLLQALPARAAVDQACEPAGQLRPTTTARSASATRRRPHLRNCRSCRLTRLPRPMNGVEFGDYLQDPCQVDVERVEDTAVVRVSGSLDVDCGKVLGAALDELPGEDANAIVVDLRGLEFVDSAGLRILLEHQLRSQKKGFGFALIAPHGHPKKVFDMTNIGQVIEVRPDPDAPTSDAAKAADRASAGLGTDDPDPADWLHRRPGLGSAPHDPQGRDVHIGWRTVCRLALCAGWRRRGPALRRDGPRIRRDARGLDAGVCRAVCRGGLRRARLRLPPLRRQRGRAAPAARHRPAAGGLDRRDRVRAHARRGRPGRASHCGDPRSPAATWCPTGCATATCGR